MIGGESISKISEFFEYLRQCPQLSNLWSIGATEDIDVRVIFPQGASAVYQYQERVDTLGGYECDIVPYPSVYEDYQINCYTVYDNADSSEPSQNVNVLKFDDVQAICDWVMSQNESGNLPQLSGFNVVSVECVPNVPQIRYVNADESTIAYFITVRLRYVNKAKGRCVEFGN